MLQTDHFVEPDLDLGKGVTCLMLTRKFLDERSQVSSNLLSSITGKPVQFMKQVHGVNIRTVNSYANEPFDETDGIFTKSSYLSLGVQTADCIPLALSAVDGSEIALLHVGWKGLCDGIIESFLTKHVTKNKQYNAWIGPCITISNYEVGKDVYDKFCQADPISETNFKIQKKGKWKLDLRLEAARRLKLGNVNVSSSRDCTFENDALYYSYRNNQSKERMITLIWRNNEK